MNTNRFHECGLRCVFHARLRMGPLDMVTPDGLISTWHSGSRRIREQKMKADLAAKEREEVHNTKFVANPVPQHVYVPRYSQMHMAETSRKRASSLDRPMNKSMDDQAMLRSLRGSLLVSCSFLFADFR